MAHGKFHADVRSPAEGVAALDMQGDLSASSEGVLLLAHDAAGDSARTILLNFGEVGSMDSLGAGLLIAFLARARNRRQRLLAYGLNASCRRAFALLRLDEAVPVHTDETDALVDLRAHGSPRPSTRPAAKFQEPQAPESAAGWAEPVVRLRLPSLPREAISVNTEGRRPTGPVKGFGSLWRRTYTIRLENSPVAPADVVRVWKERYGSFWPPAGHYFAAQKSIEAGDVALLNLKGPAGLTIATGIRVIYADSDSFAFMSSEGHMFGGLITFSAHAEAAATVVQVQALLRASDPLFEIAARLGLTTGPEDRFWRDTLKNLAAHFGVREQGVRQQAELLDRSLQWAEAKSVWYNGAIRSVLHTPVRWLRLLGIQ